MDVANSRLSIIALVKISWFMRAPLLVIYVELKNSRLGGRLFPSVQTISFAQLAKLTHFSLGLRGSSSRFESMRLSTRNVPRKSPLLSSEFRG
jgi:hypothetical protein